MIKKILSAIKTAWIYNLAIFLIGAIFIAGGIKTVNPPVGEASSKQIHLKVGLPMAETINNKQKKIETTTKTQPSETQTKETITYKTVKVPTNTQTKIIGGKKTPKPQFQYATLQIERVGTFKTKILQDDSAFTLMLRTAAENSFSINYKVYSFGALITTIAGIYPEGGKFWFLYYNGAFSQVGARDLIVKEGDIVSWRIEYPKW